MTATMMMMMMMNNYYGGAPAKKLEIEMDVRREERRAEERGGGREGIYGAFDFEITSSAIAVSFWLQPIDHTTASTCLSILDFDRSAIDEPRRRQIQRKKTEEEEEKEEEEEEEKETTFNVSLLRRCGEFQPREMGGSAG